MKYAIVLPAGSGKTHLSNKYEKLLDIDSFLSEDQQIILKDLCVKAMNTNDWITHQNKEYDFINSKIQIYDNSFILLLHHESKAEKYNLEVLGSFKTCKTIMNYVSKERGKKDKFRELCTVHNWKSCTNSIILDNYVLIEKEIKKILNNINKND
mgnify:CR=1 FL=1